MITIEKPEAFIDALSFYYERDWLSWSPDILTATLKAKFDYEPGEPESEKIEALREVLRSNRALKSALLFEKVVRAFNDLPLTFEVWEPVEPGELAYGLAVIRKIGGEELLEASSEAVRAYVATVLLEEGIRYAAPAFYFDIAENELAVLSKTTDEDLLAIRRAWHRLTERRVNSSDELFRRIQADMEVARQENHLDDEGRSRYRVLVRLAAVYAYLEKRGLAPQLGD